MKVRITQLAAGPRGIFDEGAILVGPPEMFTGLSYVTLEADVAASAPPAPEPDAEGEEKPRGKRSKS
jgi:hypothetical protein